MQEILRCERVVAGIGVGVGVGVGMWECGNVGMWVWLWVCACVHVCRCGCGKHAVLVHGVRVCNFSWRVADCGNQSSSAAGCGGSGGGAVGGLVCPNNDAATCTPGTK